MQNIETEKEAAIARAQEECDHIDKINELLREASATEKLAIATLAIANIDLALPMPQYVTAYMTFSCTVSIQTAYRHIRHIGEAKKSAIARSILRELFPPTEEEEAEEEEEEEYGDKHIFAALEAGDLNKALRIAAALDEEADFAAFRAEAIASR